MVENQETASSVYVNFAANYREQMYGKRRCKNQMVQPQKTRKKQSIETKTKDSNTVIKVHRTSSTICTSNHHRKVSVLHPVEKEKKSKSGHRKIEDPTEKSKSSHRNADEDQIPHISLSICVKVLLQQMSIMLKGWINHYEYVMVRRYFGIIVAYFLCMWFARKW